MCLIYNHQEVARQGYKMVWCLLLLSGLLATQSQPTSAPAQQNTLDDGIMALEQQDYEQAQALLEQSLTQGPYSYEQVLSLYRALGIARAFAGDEEGARRAFRQMLAVDTTLILSYTISPKATFLFEKVRQEMVQVKAAQIEVETEPVVRLGQPIPVTLKTKADPFLLLANVELLYRVKGEAQYKRLRLKAPKKPVVVLLEPVPEDVLLADAEGALGTILELAVVGYNQDGWEVYRGPTPTKPAQVAVGFDNTGPWYSQWWIWGLVGAGVAALTTAAVSTYILWPLPDDVPATYEVP